MFHPDRVEEKIAGFAKDHGWRPEPHSIEEVDAFITKMKAVFKTDQRGIIRQVRSLTKAEERFIANERVLCMCSCLYFLTRYFWIKADNTIMRFTMLPSQWVLWQMICYLDEKNVAKMIQILKARQTGISTLCEGIATWVVQFIPGVAGQVGSCDGPKTQVMMSMMIFALDQMPFWLQPTQTRNKVASDRGIITFDRIGSRMVIQSGSIRGGMGQGDTPTFVHLSEVSQYTDPVTQIDEGLIRAIHPTPKIILLLESTGDAQHRSAWWWKEQWIANRDNYWQGMAKLLPVFLPWHTRPDIYPTPSWAGEHPVPIGYVPSEETKEHVNRCTVYVRTTKLLAEILGHDWEMPILQQWFWQWSYEDAKRRRVGKSWIRQMPGDDYEALLGENDKVVGDETIEIISRTVTPIDRTSVYMLTGEEIPERREPLVEQVWYGADALPRLEAKWTIQKTGTKLDWMFVPLKPEPKRPFSPKDEYPLEKFLVYEEWEDGWDYSIGADTGSGRGGDRTILSVTKTGIDEEPDYQVAEFATDSIEIEEIYTYIAALAALYSPCEGGPHPKICIEMKRKFGDLPYHMTKQLGFKRWHEWGYGFDRKTFRENGLGKHARIGWYTNEWSRPLLLSAFQGAIAGGWYVVRSPWLKDELENLEQKFMSSGKTRVDHSSGLHDDRVFAAAMSYWTLHQNDVLLERSKKRYERPSNEDIKIQTGSATHHIVIPGGKQWERWQLRERTIASRQLMR